MSNAVTTKRKRGRPKKDPGEKKAGRKHLHVRNRVQFAVEFWAGWDGQNDTTFIETACEFYADVMAKKHQAKWRSIFHPHEGVRWLRTYLIDNYPLTDAHEARRNWVMQHREFFYIKRDDKLLVNILYVEALCGPMDGPESQRWAVLDSHRSKSKDAFASGHALAATLTAHNITPPEWPPQ